MCQGVGIPYPNSAAKLKHLHALQITKNYLIIPETSYLNDPCSKVYPDPSLSAYPGQYKFDPSVDATIVVVDMVNSAIVGHIEVPPMFTTHMLGAYEDEKTGQLHFDMLQYNDASVYTKWTYVEDALSNEDPPSNFTSVVRYSLKMTDWSLLGIKNLIKTDSFNSLEFSNINPAYQGKPYQYAYMSKNPFKRFGSVVKLNVDTGDIIEKELPDGLFPTEPIFLAAPNALSEDDGLILMSVVDGRKGKGFFIAYNATTMDVIVHATAPKLALFGLHSKFYPFDVGCGFEDCTPDF